MSKTELGKGGFSRPRRLPALGSRAEVHRVSPTAPAWAGQEDGTESSLLRVHSAPAKWQLEFVSVSQDGHLVFMYLGSQMVLRTAAPAAFAPGSVPRPHRQGAPPDPSPVPPARPARNTRPRTPLLGTRAVLASPHRTRRQSRAAMRRRSLGCAVS